jgi:hypothetical protein
MMTDSIYYKFILNFLTGCNKRVVSILVKLSPVLASKYLYRITMGKKLNLKNPRDFNEKLQWLKLYWQHPLVAKCADKYEVRSYVKDCGCGEILNELYGAYDDVSEINWDELPKKFALKTTNACGTGIICNDKDKLNKREVFKKLRKWLKIDYGKYFAEIHYSKMKPKIVVEKYLGSEDGVLPFDYRFYCFNGEPKIILFSIDRATELKCGFYDIEWNRINIENKNSKKFNNVRNMPKPECLEKMLEYAKKLSKPFPFVRVDFYNYKNEPVFGEMTFTPNGCMVDYHNNESLENMGEWIKLPKKYIEVGK